MRVDLFPEHGADRLMLPRSGRYSAQDLSRTQTFWSATYRRSRRLSRKKALAFARAFEIQIRSGILVLACCCGGDFFLAVDGVERTPKRIQGVLSGRHDFVFIRIVGMFFEPGSPGGTVGFVGFFVDGKIGESFRLIDAVELF